MVALFGALYPYALHTHTAQQMFGQFRTGTWVIITPSGMAL